MFGFKKKQKKNNKKESRKNIIVNFVEIAYLEANPDVKEGIEKGEFKDALHHLEAFGYDEIKQGLRKFHKDFEPFSENKYRELFSDVLASIEKGKYSSGFDHFCQVGYKEILDALKDWSLVNKPSNNLDSYLIFGFDDEAYLSANPDLKKSIENKDFFNLKTYLEEIGYQKIKKGESKFHVDFDVFNEEKYFNMNYDVRVAIRNGEFKSGFEHFCLNGYNEIIMYKRDYPTIMQTKITNDIGVEKYSNNFVIKERKSVDIILPVYNALDDVKKCIDSVYRNMSYPCRLIVIDDHSDYDTEEYLHKESIVKKFDLFRNKENLRFTKSVNRGFEVAQGDIVILLNSDTIVTKNWIEKILICFEHDEKFGIVGPLSNAASWQTVPVRDNPKGGWLINEIPPNYSIEKMSKLVENISRKVYPEVPSVNGFCYAIKREVLELNGNLDEEYFPTGYGEEDDFSIRTRNAGYKIAVVDDTYIYHSKSKSYTHEIRKYLTSKGRVSLDKKHGKEIIDKLIKDWKEEKNVPTIAKNIESYMHISEGNKKIVYTAIFGNYDDLKDPEYINKDWDYVCFTDNKKIKSNVYTVKYVNPIFLQNVRNARMLKVLPHLFLIGYDYSLWIDGSVRLRGRNINNLIKEMEYRMDYLFVHEHIKRDCVYDEGMACILMEKDDEQDIIKQLKYYKESGYSDKNGLVETAELLRKHQNENVELFNNEWWSILNTHSFRDQLSFNFAIWKNNLSYGNMKGVQWQDQYFKMFKHGNMSFKKNIQLPPVTIMLLMDKETIDNVEKIALNILKKTVYSSKIDVFVIDYDCMLENEVVKKVTSSTRRIHIVKPKPKMSKIEVVNYYAKKIKTEYFCIINNNVKVMSKDWLDTLGRTLYENKKCIMVAPAVFDSKFVIQPNTIKITNIRDDSTFDFKEKINIGGVGQTSAINPSCALIKTTLYNEVGGLNNNSKSFLVSFIDFCKVCNNYNYEVHINSDSEISSSFIT